MSSTPPESTDLPPCALRALAPASSERLRWFSVEVHAHESALRRYLQIVFPRVRDVDDVIQECYLRVWQASLARPVISAKSFLFQIARNLLVDGVRRARVARTESLGDLASLSVLDDRPDPVQALTYADKVGILGAALASLPARCRETMILRKIQNIPQAEIASRLSISERSVESQITRGMKLIEARVRERGLHGFVLDER